MRSHISRRGAAGQQYALVVGLIAVLGIVAVTSLGANIRALFATTGNTLTGVTNGALGGGGGTNGQAAPSFSFPALTDQALSVVIPSAVITPADLGGAQSVSVAGGGTPQININGGGWVTSGTITPGQTLQARLTSSASPSTAVTATVTIGSASAVFSVTTMANGGPWVFTSCNQTGYAGPSQGQCNSAYALTTLAGLVTVADGIQQWTVPVTGTYRIEALGAQGAASGNGSYPGGLGARRRGDLTLTANTTLKILVGQAGSTGSNVNNVAENGGGGGSFVTTSANLALVIAGGGGGARGAGSTCGYDVGHGLGQANTTSMTCYYTAGGSSNGAGGGSNTSYHVGGGGGGLTGNGGNGGTHCGASQGGQSFTNGGQGGNATASSCYTPKPHGGFGGGGAGALASAGGGGGYSGGAAGAGLWSSYSPAGKGGSSYLAPGALEEVSYDGWQSGAGQVTIQYRGP